MILYGLKIWTNNIDWFKTAASLYAEKKIDFIELYNNPEVDFAEEHLSTLLGIPISIHNANTKGFHEFLLGPEQLLIWKTTLRLADYFSSKLIVIHPGQKHTFESFLPELKKIDDPRIVVENMPGLDLAGVAVFGQKLSDLKKIKEHTSICFDLEKAVTAANYQGLDYKEYITDCLQALKPRYFQISGTDSNQPSENHGNLWESNMDFKWIKNILTKIAEDQHIQLVFEVPKKDGLQNDLRNMEFFRNL